MTALSFHITGIVQGVGFRPFVYNLAEDLGLAGWVFNSSEGVFCLVEGTEEAVGAFADRLRSQAPPMSVIESIVAEEVESEGFAGFEIRESQAIEGAMTLISPDIATCDACVTELLGPQDRRARYPFINCTNCGPRFTIIEDIPYDRPQTTMRDFPMCDECTKEYGDPSDRRFHAQPDACFVCGPRLYLNVAPDAGGARDLPPDAAWTRDAEVIPRPHRDRSAERERSDAIVAEV
ncbi:MAG: acylphosphatase, partial [Coriobacteriia bacterium]|nr:acylphosphatase [Coriobacteriia bacterium]